MDDLSDIQMILGVKQSDKGLSTLGSATSENAMSAGKAWVGDNYNVIKDNLGNILGYSSLMGCEHLEFSISLRKACGELISKRTLWLIINILIQDSIVLN